MSGLLTRAGYEPVIAENMEAAKQEVTKLSPGAVIVSAMNFRYDTASQLINWLMEEVNKFPVLAVMDNLNPMELIDVMSDWGIEHSIEKIGAANANMIIFGEIGMGSEQVARGIYEHSSRA